MRSGKSLFLFCILLCFVLPYLAGTAWRTFRPSGHGVGTASTEAGLFTSLASSVEVTSPVAALTAPTDDSGPLPGGFVPEQPKKEYIKWMEFAVPAEVMAQALKYDIQSYGTETPINWVELIAYGAAKNWGTYKGNRASADIDEAVRRLQNGETMADLSENLKLYPFYLESYGAVLNGFVGEFEREEENPEKPGERIFVKKYGLKVFSPVAKGFGYSHYDDFGVSRSYGFRRKHVGNDIMGRVGTPIVAVEDGTVEVMGWNPYGGWRIGIRSRDKKRYYYYAHLRKDHPFHRSLEEGATVQAGDVLGYLGMTGYSHTENVNNIAVPHLHIGMQIIFDESQKESVNQIWIDMYELVRFLSRSRMEVYQTETKDYEPAVRIHTIPED